ncbi:unnamed protein product [Rhizophagus irregularis]|nr:unnamed protein product [Rhizophagus irregularis]
MENNFVTMLAQQREDEVLFQFELAHKRIKSAVENNVRSTALSDKTNITGAILRGTYEDQESKSKRKATCKNVTFINVLFRFPFWVRLL